MRGMRLDRNVNANGMGKYAILNLRTNTIEWGRTGEADEFFVIKLRDCHAPAALNAYAADIEFVDPEFAEEVREMARRSGWPRENGEGSIHAKKPD